MALPKAVGCILVILATYYSLESLHSHVLNVFSEGVMDTKAPRSHVREKRETLLNASEYVLQAVVNISDLERLQTILSTFTFPLQINSTEITSINTTTVCLPNTTGFQCRCEQSFAWSYNSCISHGACDDIVSNTCGCINSLPTDGQYCQLNTSQTDSTPSPTPPNESTPSPTTPYDPVDIDIVLDLRIPVSGAPPSYINVFRETLAGFTFPYVTQSFRVVSINFTTGCYLNSTGGLQCQCEEQFAWSCDKCNIYGGCSNASEQTCGCINGLPSDGEFCEPIANVLHCPTTTLGIPTTIPITMTTSVPTITTPMTSLNTTPLTSTSTTLLTSTSTTLLTSTSTTPLTSTSTTPLTSTSTTLTSTSTTPLTSTSTTPLTPPAIVHEETFTMNLDFDPSFNNPTSEVYRTSYTAILRQCETHISNLDKVEIIRFRSGSTICDYSISTTSAIDVTEVDAVKTGIFTDLSEKYSMILDSEAPLKFDPSLVFFGDSVTVTCGPPPESLGFTTNWVAEWRRNGQPLLEDSQHRFVKENGNAILRVSQSFSIDEGDYECRLKDNSLAVSPIFRQKSNSRFVVKAIPVLQVNPIRENVQCVIGNEVTLKCSVNRPYEVEFKDISDAGSGNSITYQFSIPNCDNPEQKFICQEKTYPRFSREITLLLSTKPFTCVNDDVFGNGHVDDKGVAPCDPEEVGEKTAVCKANGKWEDEQDNCILQVVQDLLQQSQFLNNNSLPGFLNQLSSVTANFTSNVTESPANINAIVEILNNIANVAESSFIPITKTLMEDFLSTAGVLTTDQAQDSWRILNANDTRNTSETRRSSPRAESVSSNFLQSIETVTRALTQDSFNIDTPSILLNKTTFTDTFNADFSSSVEVEIPESDGKKKSITVITFASMDNVLPARDEVNSTLNVINGRVVLVQSNSTINNVSFTFDILNDTIRNDTLGNPQCVFWNFSLLDGLGGWDGDGCKLVISVNETVTCSCNHLTSFSILMSPFSPDDPVLDFITYIGVGISMASLVICLIIEAVIWRKISKNNTSYLRHVSIVNIAVSLLIANIWFIIGAAISGPKDKAPPACSAATFFIHFFYLALFFWMLASALLLLYRTVSVFDNLSTASMLAIGFSIGYGAPLIIAIITIAVTAPRQQYIRERGVCWLNWDGSKALLAFVIPALLIVAINLIILFVVIYKMLRRRAVGNAAQAAERHVLLVIARSLAVLTPFFGLTWGLGVGTMVNPNDRGIHISFAFFNSLQGFFILVFGTLLDKKVRSEIAIKSTSGSGTRSTSGGNSSSSGLGFLRNWRRGRDGYNTSSTFSNT